MGIGVRDAELRDLGETIQALPSDHPIAGVVKRAKDFAQPDALADALLNPQDRAYSVPSFTSGSSGAGSSSGAGMSRRPIFRNAARSRTRRTAARLAALPSRAQHAAMELLRGTMDRHSFIAYRDDREREAQPITFEGDAWRVSFRFGFRGR